MRRLKQVTYSLLATAPLLISQIGHAESGVYLGGSVGHASVGRQDANLNVDINDDDIGYKLYGGFKFTLLAVEAGYVDFGNIGGNESNVEISGFNAFGVLSMGLGPVEVFGKAGGFVWESDFSTAQQSLDDNGFDPAIGLGAAFNLGGMSVRAEYEYFDIDEFDKVSMVSVGATFWLL